MSAAPAPKALRAFYGASDRLAATEPPSGVHLNTLKTLIGTPDKDRPQEIYTPPAIRDLLVQLWGAIRLDPCAGPGSILGPERAYFGEQIDTGRVRKDGRKILKWEGSGLTHPWTDCTYVNPPFTNLEDWLAKALEEVSCGFEVAVLAPVRPHRVWWRDAVLKNADAIGWLNPVSFVGYDSAFPEALVLAYYGPRPSQFKLLFEDAGLGYAEVRPRG